MADSKQATWRQCGLKYYSLKYYHTQNFTHPVRKITIDARFSCPNMDGTVGTGGCIFCENRSFSPSRRTSIFKDQQIGEKSTFYREISAHSHPVAQSEAVDICNQIRCATRHYEIRDPEAKFVAYFQPSTNTYAPVRQLELLYRAALAEKNIIGLSIGTRPDVLPEAVLDLLEVLASETRLTVELGLQSTHNKTLQFLNRGHNYQVFLDAYRQLTKRNINVCIHLILGLPNEFRNDILSTAEEIAKLRPHSVKLHNLYVPRGTLLAEMYHDERVRIPTIDQYAGYVVDFLERQSPETVIDRLVADGHTSHTIAPSWYRNKNLVFHQIEAEFERRNSYQGKGYAKSR